MSGTSHGLNPKIKDISSPPIKHCCIVTIVLRNCILSYYYCYKLIIEKGIQIETNHVIKVMYTLYIKYRVDIKHAIFRCPHREVVNMHSLF